jgi:hypothetical protein
MIHDMLVVADRFLRIQDTLLDPEKFCKLDDDIIHIILDYDGEENSDVIMAKDLCIRFIAKRPWWYYKGLTRDPEQKDVTEGSPYPRYVEYSGVAIIDWQESSKERYYKDRWSLFVADQAPFRALPKVPFFDDKRNVVYPFAKYPRPEYTALYHHVLQ